MWADDDAELWAGTSTGCWPSWPAWLPPSWCGSNRWSRTPSRRDVRTGHLNKTLPTTRSRTLDPR